MLKSKAIALFLTLSPAERRRFKKWVQSPIHNPNTKLSAFYLFLDSRSEWTARSLRRERAFAAVYGEQVYDDLTMRRLLSEFLEVLKAFLIHEARLGNPVSSHIALARQCRDRQLTAEAHAEIEVAARLLLDQPVRDAGYYLDAYRIQEEKFFQMPARDAMLNLQEMADELSRFFAAEMLRVACMAASHSAIYRAAYSVSYLEGILADCEAGRYDDAPVIRVYWHSYCCLTQRDAESHFFRLKPLLPTASKWLPVTELRQVFLFAINYCIRRVNTDETGFMREVFELYQIGLAQEVFVENGFLSRFTFKNIVAAALQLGELTWTEQFIGDWAPRLPDAFRDAYERLCTAKLYYAQRHYDRAQSLLLHLTFDDVFLDLSARALLLKIYFEASEWRLLEGYLKAFEQFVRRKKTLAYHAPNYLNFIHFTSRLVTWRSGRKAFHVEELAALRQQISEAKPLTEKAWLLEMMEG